MNHEAVLRDIASKIPVHPSAGKRRIWIALLVVGAVAVRLPVVHESAARLGRVGDQHDLLPRHRRGAIAFAAAIRLSNGRWGGPLQRIAESFAAYLPAGIATMGRACCSWASGSTCRGRATSSRGRRRS